MSFLLFQGSRPGLFKDLSAGESCPLRIPPITRGLQFPPLVSRKKNGGLSPVNQKKHQGLCLGSRDTGMSPCLSTLQPIVRFPIYREKTGITSFEHLCSGALGHTSALAY